MYVPIDGVPGNDKLTSESPTIHELTWFVITSAFSGSDLECKAN